MSEKKIKSALISVFYKDGLDEIVKTLHSLDVKIWSTGGTYNFIHDLGIPAKKVEDLTTYPSILGGRVKTLNTSVFGGILARRGNLEDMEQVKKYNIPEIDLVIVDLYPFENTVKNETDEEEIIEKIDIGGISLIRAAAKNYNDVLIVSGREQYPGLLNLLKDKKGYMWFGTDYGLNKYDGYGFTYYLHDNLNSNSISYDIITSIGEDNIGNLWIGTKYGLNKFDPVKEVFERFYSSPDEKNTLASNKIRLVFVDSKSRI